jgi:periplasmic copper chaperone A
VTRTEGATVNSAAYFTLVNRLAEPLALVGAHTQAAARTEIHETHIEDGVMRMRPAAKVDLPAGTERRFEPGGLHVMLMDVQRDLAAGDSLDLVLQFGDGTEHATWLVVRPATL